MPENFVGYLVEGPGGVYARNSIHERRDKELAELFALAQKAAQKASTDAAYGKSGGLHKAQSLLPLRTIAWEFAGKEWVSMRKTRASFEVWWSTDAPRLFKKLKQTNRRAAMIFVKSKPGIKSLKFVTGKTAKANINKYRKQS